MAQNEEELLLLLLSIPARFVSVERGKQKGAKLKYRRLSLSWGVGTARTVFYFSVCCAREPLVTPSQYSHTARVQK